MATIGIDYGSSNSTVAWINPKSGNPEAVKFNGDGSVKMPSMIFATEHGFNYGFQAAQYFDEITKLPAEQRRLFLPNFVPCLKRILNPNESEWFFEHSYSHFQLLSGFFEHIISQVKLDCGDDFTIDKVCISHPIDFPKYNVDLLTSAIKNCRDNLNLEVVTQYEPISAVKGYGNNHDVKDGDGILVFDFGGGTIDVAFVQKKIGKFNVITEPRGNSLCGGQDIDLLLYENLRNTIINEYHVDISENGEVDQIALSACRRLKEKFSGKMDTYETMLLLPINGRLHNYRYCLDRNSFNSVILPVVNQAINVADMVIQDVKNRNVSIDKVLLIGGSSQLTLIRDLLQERFDGNVPVETCGEKDIVVALGNICSDDLLNSSIPDTPKIDFAFPTNEPLNKERFINCKRCSSKNCFHFRDKKGYHCLDCGWEGLNVSVQYK